MRISTLLTVFNMERYVAQALDSVLAQTHRSDEIIVVDDGSTDQTPDILRSFADRILPISQQNLGAAGALNVAIGVATGDTFAFLDADDIWIPEKLQIQSMALSADKDLEAVFGAIQQFASPDLAADIGQRYFLPDGPQAGICKTAMLIRRSAFDRIGLFAEEHKASDFFEWFSRANELGLRFQMLPELVALRRQHPENTGRRLRKQQHHEILGALKRSLDSRRNKLDKG